MRLWVVYILVASASMNGEAVKSRLASERSFNPFKRLKKNWDHESKRDKAKRKALKKAYKHYKQNKSVKRALRHYRDDVKSELDRLKEEEERDQGEDFRLHKERGRSLRDRGERRALHKVTDSELKVLQNDLERSIIDDIESFVKAVGSY